ncbi:MAG: acylneuraminate cytidylyltransferase family protein [Oscillospiraceae bacterium]|nr:acylneuraminate cytidylyltransferase family protein [Oscillospiraceae bacterium]
MTGVTAIIPVKQNSTRLPGKNILPFGGSNLLIHKIRQLKQVASVSEIVVSTDSAEMLEMAGKEGAVPLPRPKRYADESLPISEFVSYLGDVVGGRHFMWSCVTSPLVEADLYAKAISLYLKKLDDGYDSLVTVCRFQHYLMDENGPYNFSRGRAHTNSQQLKKLYLFTNGIQLTPREKYKEWGDRIGPKPYLMEVSKNESVDIDDIYDYEFALSIYERSRQDGSSAFGLHAT